MKSLLQFTAILILSISICAAAPVSFTNDIAPILVQKCLTCHGPEKNKGNYRLDTFEMFLKPGSSKETPIASGKPAESKVFQLITTTDEDDRMPQKNEPLSTIEVGRIKQWIAEGAKFDAPDPKAPLVAIVPLIPQPNPPAQYKAAVPITALAFSADGSELAASGYHEITIWNPATGDLLRRIKNVAQNTYSIQYQPNGQFLAAASGTPGKIGEVKLFDAKTGALVKVLVTGADSMLALAFSADGSKLATGGSDNAIRIFDMASLKQEKLIEQHADWITGLAFNHAGTMLASASRDKSARLYDPRTGEMEHSYLGHGDFVFDVAFGLDDKRVFSSGRDRKVHIWNASDAKKEKGGEISFDDEALKVLVTSNFVFVSSGQTIRQHSLEKNRELVRTFAGQTDVIYSLALSEPTQRLAAASFDGRIRIWNLKSGEPLLTFLAAPGLNVAERKP